MDRRDKLVSSPIDCISEFIFVSTVIEPSDVILVPGGSHPQLMQEAVRLYHEGYAPFILPSGGANSKLANHDSEWHFLQGIGVSLGVPENAILTEDKANDTFENACFSYDVLVKKGIGVKQAIIVCKAFHARRAMLTYQYCFPTGTEFFVSPVPDKKGITKNNWCLDNDSVHIVMEEVRKIGTYFTDKIEHLLA